MNKFYIGQKIVAIKDHSQGIFKKGDEFTGLGLKSLCCENLINVGINSTLERSICKCRKTHNNKDIYHWFCESIFAPIELSTTTFEDVIKQYEPCLN